MTRLTHIQPVLVGLLAIVVAGPAFGAIDVGSDGSDGAFSPVTDVTVDLSLAADAAWDTPSPVAGQGVYDSTKWAVVFKYSSVNIPAGVTVTFTNHPSRAPVVWLANGSVTIDGTVSLNGSNGSLDSTIVEPGPGGFRGGRGDVFLGAASSAGFGPGAGGTGGQFGFGGSYGTLGQGNAGPTYGNEQVLPLIGGSGGGGDNDNTGGGGAGGGALVIAANDSIVLEGVARANGGSYADHNAGGGSGGAVRLIADAVNGSGTLRALGGNGWYVGAMGRLRVEANSISLSDIGAPPYTAGTPCAGEGCTPEIFAPASAPAVRIMDIAGMTVPTDPRSSFDFPSQDVSFADPDPVTVRVEAQNVPLTWNVKVRVTPREGNYIEAGAVLESGDATLSTWTADIAFPNKFSAVQARACDPAQGSPGCP